MMAGGGTSRSSFGGNTRWAPEDRFDGGLLSLRENLPSSAGTPARGRLWVNDVSGHLRRWRLVERVDFGVLEPSRLCVKASHR